MPGVLLLTGRVVAGLAGRSSSVPAHVPIAVAADRRSRSAAAIVRRRFAAALFLGVVGYAMAALFVVQGAPDLALTQVAVETLSTVLFVLVLRRLPDRFERHAGAAPPGRAPRRRRRRRRPSCSLFTLAAGRRRTRPTDVSDAMVARALPDGDGRNVVNVILVDIRGFDTLGEITVLAAAAIGAVALARAGRRPGRRRRRRAAERRRRRRAC